eukprot:3941952-Rhodomonas_salina.5
MSSISSSTYLATRGSKVNPDHLQGANPLTESATTIMTNRNNNGDNDDDDDDQESKLGHVCSGHGSRDDNHGSPESVPGARCTRFDRGLIPETKNEDGRYRKGSEKKGASSGGVAMTVPKRTDYNTCLCTSRRY